MSWLGCNVNSACSLPNWEENKEKKIKIPLVEPLMDNVETEQSEERRDDSMKSMLQTPWEGQ